MWRGQSICELRTLDSPAKVPNSQFCGRVLSLDFARPGFDRLNQRGCASPSAAARLASAERRFRCPCRAEVPARGWGRFRERARWSLDGVCDATATRQPGSPKRHHPAKSLANCADLHDVDRLRRGRQVDAKHHCDALCDGVGVTEELERVNAQVVPAEAAQQFWAQA